jgi:hypothetical protein
MASTLIPNILQSDNGGEFLGETLAMINRWETCVTSICLIYVSHFLAFFHWYCVVGTFLGAMS